MPITPKFLKALGISNQLHYKYVQSGWLNPVEQGVFCLPGSTITWKGALYALQNHLNKRVHLGGRTALEFYGLGHFLSLSVQKIFLFKLSKERLPHWFKKLPWKEAELIISSTNVIEEKIGIEKEVFQGLDLSISSPERAALEVIYLLGKHHTLEEIFLLSENFVNFRPKVMQDLLEKCNSKKVKRTAMMLGKHHQAKWFNRLDLNKIELGNGIIQLEGGGHYIKDFNLSIPKKIASHTRCLS